MAANKSLFRARERGLLIWLATGSKGNEKLVQLVGTRAELQVLAMSHKLVTCGEPMEEQDSRVEATTGALFDTNVAILSFKLGLEGGRGGIKYGKFWYWGPVFNSGGSSLFTLYF